MYFTTKRDLYDSWAAARPENENNEKSRESEAKRERYQTRQGKAEISGKNTRIIPHEDHFSRWYLLWSGFCAAFYRVFAGSPRYICFLCAVSKLTTCFDQQASSPDTLLRRWWSKIDLISKIDAIEFLNVCFGRKIYLYKRPSSETSSIYAVLRFIWYFSRM